MRVLDLFSGIGGFSLGLERAGMQTAAFCEIEPFCRDVLAKHWPGVPIYDDIRTVTAARLANDGIEIDVICGGFPCQDISTAGKGAGLAGERSGLWYEYHRLIEEIRPKYAIIENVSALRSRGLDAVLGSLAALGYDAEWHCIPASAVGAPHQRDRIWIVANTVRPRGEIGLSTPRHREERHPKIIDDSSSGFDGWSPSDYWATEPDVGRVANGVPARTHRLRALGNAVVPQIPQIIGEWIIRYEQSRNQ